MQKNICESCFSRLVILDTTKYKSNAQNNVGIAHIKEIYDLISTPEEERENMIIRLISKQQKGVRKNIHLYCNESNLKEQLKEIIKSENCLVYDKSISAYDPKKHTIILWDDFTIGKQFLMTEKMINNGFFTKEAPLLIIISSQPMYKHYFDDMNVTMNNNQPYLEELHEIFFKTGAIEYFDKINISNLYSNLVETKLTSSIIKKIESILIEV